MAKIAEPPPRPRSDDPNVLFGVAASPGLAVGTVFQVRREEIMVEEEGRGVEHEQQLARQRDRQGARPARRLARTASLARPIQPRPRSSPPTPNCSTIPTFSRSPTPPSPRAKAPPSPGRAPQRSTPSGSLRCAMNCSRSARTMCAMSACACSNFSPASRACRRPIPKARSSSPRISRLPTPPRWREDVSSGSPRCAAARLRTSPSSRVRWKFRPSPGIEPRALEIANGTPVILDGRQRHAASESAAGGSRSASGSGKRVTKAQRKEDIAHALRAGRDHRRQTQSTSSPTSAD